MARRNETPNTPDVSETELRDLKVDELRERAREAGVGGTSGMRKDDLVNAIVEAVRGGDGGANARSDGGAGEPGDAGPDGGRLRRGEETSKSLKYSQESPRPTTTPNGPAGAWRPPVTR